MGISDFIIGQFIDVIEYIDESNKLLVYKIRLVIFILVHRTCK